MSELIEERSRGKVKDRGMIRGKKERVNTEGEEDERGGKSHLASLSLGLMILSRFQVSRPQKAKPNTINTACRKF